MKNGKRSVGRPREVAADKPRARRVMRLRDQGLSFNKIGERMGFSKQHARQLYLRVLAERSA